MGYFMIHLKAEDNCSLRPFKEELCNYDIAVGNMFSNLAVMPVSKELIKDLYNQLHKLPKSPYISEGFQLLNGGGLLFSEGADWKRKRKIISSVFHFEFLNSLVPIIDSDIESYYPFIDQQIKEGKPVDLLKIFIKLFSGVVAKTFFGTDMTD
jgi:cytochrome P450